MNKKEFEQAIAKIGWSIKGKWPNQWVHDKEGKKTTIWVKTEGIEVRGNTNTFVIYANYESIVVELTSDDCVSIYSKNDNDKPSLFIQLYSH